MEAGPIKIVHLADVHIQSRRRREYDGVFKQLYASLRAEKPDVVVVAGDVFDTKTQASPYDFDDVAQFFRELVSIAPVVAIPGNHDTNCLAPGSLDLIQPLIADHRHLQAPAMTYIRDTGSVEAHGIRWVAAAVDGPLPPVEGHGPTPRVLLFHEDVDGASRPNGEAVREARMGLADLAPYDLALGGHIHLRQSLSPRAAYCGSLIQQTVGEGHLHHGYLLWTLERDPGAPPPYRTAVPGGRGVDLPNVDGGFLRVELDRADDGAACSLESTVEASNPCEE